MPVRASTSDLRAKLRQLLNDPDGVEFTELQLQDFLDDVRATVNQAPIEVVLEKQPGGASDRKRKWRARCGVWESGVTFQDEDYATITPSTSDLWLGQWAFATDYESVFITGLVHNVYGAAVDALRVLVARVAPDFDTKIGELSVDLSQQHKGLLALLAEYERKSADWVGRQVYDATSSPVGYGELILPDFTGF